MMPHDPRPISEGGNKAINEPGSFKSMAPKGKFRVTGFDSFDGGDWLVGDYDTREKAVRIAKDRGGQMTLMYVWDDRGKKIYSAGKF